MNYSKAFISFLLFTLLSLGINAQVVLKIRDIQGIPDTVKGSAPYSLNASIIADSGSTGNVTGVLSLYYKTDFKNIDTVMATGDTLSNFGAGDSTNFFIPNFSFDPSYFRLGVNVVVVWPVAPNTIASADTFKVSVEYDQIQGLTIINPSEDFLTLSPNPFTNQLSVKWEGMPYKNLKIYDLTGKLVYSQAYHPTTKLSTTMWKQGLYLVSIATAEGSVITKKLVKK